MTTERMTDETLAVKLRKRADQIGNLLTDPPKDAPDAALMRDAADALARRATPADDLRAENERLREYARHKRNCDLSRAFIDSKVCTCGFDAALSQSAPAPAPQPADDLRAALLRWCDARQRDVVGCAELNAQEEAAAIMWLDNFRAALLQNKEGLTDRQLRDQIVGEG